MSPSLLARTKGKTRPGRTLVVSPTHNNHHHHPASSPPPDAGTFSDSHNNHNNGTIDAALVSEMQRTLELEKVALTTMRHDITVSYEEEVQRLREELRRVKWDYDHVRVENNAKEKKLLELAGGLVRYLGVSEAEQSTGVEAAHVLKNYEQLLKDSEDDLAAEHRTQKMLTLMAYRLDEETNLVRAEAAQVEQGAWVVRAC